MYCTKKITDDLLWVGGNDRRIALFENAIPVPRGISYNSYLLTDEKTVLFDAVDKAISEVFFENITHALDGRTLDFLVVTHMEPDHCATMDGLVMRYPELKIVCNKKSFAMIKQFFSFDIDSRAVIVEENQLFSTGRHTLTFIMAPMVHWPEVMVAYDTTDKILFSSDAFGAFGALSGDIFADEVNFESDYMDEARRYYSNIVGKYGAQVTALLKKAESLEISYLCPLHGPVWRKNIGSYISKYRLWSSYTPEENGVLIAYASIYGHTENAAEILAAKLSDLGVHNIHMYDVSVTHPSYILSQAFKYSHIVLASTTYNAGIFCNMETLLHDIAAHNLQKRTFALIENGSWASTAGSLMKELLSKLKNVTILENTVNIKSALKENQLAELDGMASAIRDSMPGKLASDISSSKIDNSAMFSISYGLFVLTTKQNGKDNGCIINTAAQVTSAPMSISVTVNKQNLTHDMILNTGEFNVSILTSDAPFDIFKHFGFSSGRETDKFAGYESCARADNGIFYITDYANSYISCKVTTTVDCGTHTVFIADITEAKRLSTVPSVTYQYYFDNIKPKPELQKEQTKGYICKICGYVYEGEPLPDDFICPICKHGAEDFEKIK